MFRKVCYFFISQPWITSISFFICPEKYLFWERVVKESCYMGDVFEMLDLAKYSNWVRIGKVQNGVTIVSKSPVKIILCVGGSSLV